ncbi:MAG: hypothetical protein ABUT20_64135 [Bacteroidota bacterium]
MDPLYHFLTTVETDPRISAAHISLYVSLWKKWKDSGTDQPLSFFRQDIINLCKISGGNTYHKVLRQLHEYGYVKYVPSYNHFLGSMVSFNSFKTTLKS